MSVEYKLNIADDCGEKLGIEDDEELTEIGVTLLRIALAELEAEGKAIGATSVMNGYWVSVNPDEDDPTTYNMTVEK